MRDGGRMVRCRPLQGQTGRTRRVHAVGHARRSLENRHRRYRRPSFPPAGRRRRRVRRRGQPGGAHCRGERQAGLAHRYRGQAVRRCERRRGVGAGGRWLAVADTVITRTGDGRVHGVSAADGSREWLYSRNLPALSLRGSGGMVARDDVLYAGFPGGKLVALNAANGAQLWEATVALPRGATELERVADVMGAPVVDERQVCAVAYQGRVACFDRRNGAPLWARDVSSNSGLAMDARNLYVTDDKDAVIAYDKDSGRAGWRQDKLARRQVTAPLAFGDWVIVADAEGYVHVLSAEDGSFVARTKVDGSVRTAPADRKS